MKFKFKITNDTTIEDAEKELENLYSAPVVDLPFNHVVKIAEFLGSKLQDSPTWFYGKILSPFSPNTWQIFWSTRCP